MHLMEITINNNDDTVIVIIYLYYTSVLYYILLLKFVYPPKENPSRSFATSKNHLNDFLTPKPSPWIEDPDAN